MPKYCDKCGEELKNENAKFCDKCGEELKNENAKFCDKCGAEVKLPQINRITLTVQTCLLKLTRKVCLLQ